MLFGENITAKVFVVDKIVQVEASMICLPEDILECIFNNIAQLVNLSHVNSK